VKWLVLAALLAACSGDVDPPWQLDHDRIVAVRATPPRIIAGGMSTIDGLIGTKGDKTHVAPPELATVVSPMALAGAVKPDAGGWVLQAPSDDQLAAARTELGLDAGAPVPVQIGVAYANQTLFATKTVVIGEAHDNPSLENVMIDDMPAGTSELAVPSLVKVPLSLDADAAVDTIAWLTSCGTMHDFDLPQAYLKVEKDDPTTGELAVVLRDDKGGVAWSVWPIHADPP
jgi:hypothetical protein